MSLRVPQPGRFSGGAASGDTGLELGSIAWSQSHLNGAHRGSWKLLRWRSEPCPGEAKATSSFYRTAGQLGRGVCAQWENCGASCLKYNIKLAPLISTLRKGHQQLPGTQRRREQARACEEAKKDHFEQHIIEEKMDKSPGNYKVGDSS